MPFAPGNIGWAALARQLPTLLVVCAVCSLGTSMDVMAVQARALLLLLILSFCCSTSVLPSVVYNPAGVVVSERQASLPIHLKCFCMRVPCYRALIVIALQCIWTRGALWIAECCTHACRRRCRGSSTATTRSPRWASATSSRGSSRAAGQVGAASWLWTCRHTCLPAAITLVCVLCVCHGL